ncbi:energy transducer TonB [Novosphingobium sp.]|uniref:energy transducer TonB n=1 Tax=Novosphingobium sp. TaxID=1874826 RepID=UPI0035B2ED78
MSIIHLILLAQSAAVAPQAPLEPLAPPPPVEAPSKGVNLVTPPPLELPKYPAVPIGNPGNWVQTDDYPTIALRQEWQGITAFRLIISPNGFVVRCDITRSSGYDVLDQATCTLITQRASFRPARDPQGNPVVGYFSSRVRWELPTTDNPYAEADGSFSTSSVTWRFFIEPDGSTSDCVVMVDDTLMQTAEPGSPCGPEMRYKPFTDANGKPVRQRVYYVIRSGLVPETKP